MFRWNVFSKRLKILLKCFNTTIVSVELVNHYHLLGYFLVSIQPLFRWNAPATIPTPLIIWFQYNHCFGGTCKSLSSTWILFAFNTTIVSVERKFEKDDPYFPKSFNTTIVSVELDNGNIVHYTLNEFQYNHCFGGTSFFFKSNIFKISFNTTIVSVEHTQKNLNL